MPRIFDTNPELLKYLLQRIHHGDSALPDFQRDFVWEPRETEELVESICRNFPAGSLLQISNAAGSFFAPRNFAGAPSLRGKEPAHLILDGQQRLTSLYQAFYGTGNHRYFIDLKKLLDGADLEDSVYYLRASVADKRFGSVEKQAKSLVFPLQQLFGSDGGFDEWLDEVLELRSEEGDERKDLKRRLKTIEKEWLDNIAEYQFPVVTLKGDTSPEAVCTIFETLNRTGVKLSVFDLLGARFWSVDVRLRDLWDQARADYAIIPEFDVDPYYIMQGIAIFAAIGAPSCKRSDVLKLTENQIRTGWEPVVRGLAEWLTFIRDECGVVVPKLLPYNTILIPGMAIMAASEHTVGPLVASQRIKLQRWFWCSVFNQAYENSPNSQAVADFGQLLGWFRTESDVPQIVANFQFDSSVLRETTVRQRALYRGVLALVLRNRARDFHTGGMINAKMIRADEIDDHHVFPTAYLLGELPRITSVQRDCVLNHTLLDKRTNIRIGKKPPSVYLVEISDQIGDQLDTVLASHLMPTGPGSSLRHDDFEAFLAYRQSQIDAMIRTVTG